jgi:type II secretion system protein I
MTSLKYFDSLLHKSTDDNSGFTLIEIVVTLAILSIGLPVLLQSFSSVANNQKLSEDKTTVLYLLKTRMAEIELQGYPDIGTEEGEFGENSPYRWRSEVHDVESDEFEEGLRAVTVTITWLERGKAESTSMNTYVANRQMPQPQNGR